MLEQVLVNGDRPRRAVVHTEAALRQLVEVDADLEAVAACCVLRAAM
jgi:hypothetical protein